MLAALGMVRAQVIERVPEAPSAGYDWQSAFPAVPSIDPLYAMSAMARFPWVYAVVTARAEDASIVPLRLVRGSGSNRTRVESHPVVDLIERPAVAMSGRLLAAQLVADRILTGCSYAILVGPPKRPSSVLRLHPERVHAIPAPDGSVLAWEYGTERKQYDPSLIVQIRGISWEDSPSGLYGQGIVRALADQLKSELASLERERISQTTGRPSVIVTPRANGDVLAPELTPEQMRDVERRVNQALTGGTGKAVALSAALELSTPGWSPSEMEAEALHTRVRDAVLAVAGVPPSRISLTTANWATAREELASYWRSTVAADVRGLCDLWTEVARRYDPSLSVVPDWTGIQALQLDRTERVNRALTLWQAGISLADALAYEGLEDAPVPETLPPAPAPSVPSATSGPAPAGSGASEPAVVPTEDQAVPDLALNGAQVSSALDIVAKVAAKELPRDSGIAALVAFLGIDEAVAEKVMGPVGSTFFVEPGEALPRSVSAALLRRASDAVRRRVQRSEHIRAEMWRAAEDRLRLPLERDLSLSVARALKAEAREAAAKIGEALGSARGSRAVPSVVDTILDQILGSRVGPAYESWIGPARERAWRDAARQVAPGRLTYTPQTDLITERTASMVTQTSQTSKDAIRAIVERGLDEGWTVNEIQRAIQTSEAMTPRRALAIARTETTAAVSASQVQAFGEAEEIGVEMRVEWLTSRDSAVRESHRRMDGQIRPVGGTFRSPTGATGSGPGEMSTAAESVNCRCTLIPVLD